MIYSFNTLGFYTSQGVRQYDNTGNVRVLHHYALNSVPAFQIVIDSIVSSAAYEVFDIDDNLISSGAITRETDQNEAGTNYTRLIFKGATVSGNTDGFYYLKITYNSTNYLWSDVFCWQSDVSEYLKVEAVSSDVAIGEFKINMDDFTYSVYLEAKGYTPEYEITEEGVEKTYGEVPLFNSRNKSNEFHITGYRATLDFLAGLRILETNGTITLTFDNDSFEVYNLENPEKVSEYNYGDIVIIGLKAKRKDYLQSINTL